MDEEEEWVDINTNRENNISIGYDYISWRILLVIMTNAENYLMKPWEG